MREDPETLELRLSATGAAAPKPLNSRHREGVDHNASRILAFALLLAFFGAYFLGLQVGAWAGALVLGVVLGAGVFWAFHRKSQAERRRDAQIEAARKRVESGKAL